MFYDQLAKKTQMENSWCYLETSVPEWELIITTDRGVTAAPRRQTLKGLLGIQSDYYFEEDPGNGLKCQAPTTAIAIAINNYTQEAVHEFIYLGSTIADDLSVDLEINKRTR